MRPRRARRDRRPTRARVCLAAAIIAIGTVACAQPGYSEAKLQRELEQAGATPTQARCVTDRLGNTFDINQLASHSDPTAKETATTRAILEHCGIKNMKPA